MLLRPRAALTSILAVRVDVCVLGATALRIDGSETPIGGRRRRQVLARLALGAPHPVSGDRLIDALWGDHAGPRARATLHVHVSNLRRVLRDVGLPDLLLTAGDGYRIDLVADAVDTNRFTRFAEEGIRHLAADHLLRARDLLADALTLWAEPFPELVDEPDILVERHRLRGLAERAEDQLVEAELGLGRAARVVDQLVERVESAPLRETSVEQLVRALATLDRHDEAGRVVVGAIGRMRDEYGVEPSERLQRISSSARAGNANRRIVADEHDPAPVAIPADLLQPGSSLLLVADEPGQRATAVDQIGLMAQRDLRRVVVIRPGTSDTAPWEAIDRAIGPLREREPAGTLLPDRDADIAREIGRRAGPAGLVVLVDVDRVVAALGPLVRTLLADAAALGITVVGTAGTADGGVPFGTALRVDSPDAEPSGGVHHAALPGHLDDLVLVVALCDPEVPIQLLVRTIGHGAAVLDLLADARARHLLAEGSPGHVRLTESGRAAVVAGGALDDRRRCAHWHLSIADAIQNTDAVSPARRRAIEARHRSAALPDGDAAAAARAVVAATDDPLGLHHYADALTVLQAASQLVEQLADDEPAVVGELLERLARASMRGGRVTDGVEWSRRLIDHGRRVDVASWRAEGVRVLGEQTTPQSLGDELVELQREAIDATIDEPTDTTVQLLTDLAGAVYFDDLAESRRHADRALALAMVVGEPGTIARALTGKMQTRLGPADVDERLELAIEAQAMARRAELRHVQVHALTYEVYALFERGRLDAVGPPLRYATELADEVQFGRVEWWVRAWEALRLLATGKFADADVAARDALERYADPDRRDAFECYASQLMCARLLRGDGAEILPLATDLVERSPGTSGYRGLRALAAAQAGDERTAHADLDAVVPSVRHLRADATLLSTGAMLAEAAWSCRRVDVAAQLQPLLEPYASSHAVLNIWGGGGFYWGPVAHLVGLTRHLTGTGDALAALRDGERAADAAGALPFAERSRAVIAELS